MIDDIKEIIGTIFMVVIGLSILITLATTLSNQVVSQFTGLGIALLVIAGLAGIFSIVFKWFNK